MVYLSSKRLTKRLTLWRFIDFKVCSTFTDTFHEKVKVIFKNLIRTPMGHKFDKERGF